MVTVHAQVKLGDHGSEEQYCEVGCLADSLQLFNPHLHP